MALGDNLKGLSAELVRAVSTRVELFGLEWQQAREDLPRLLGLWVVGLLALLFALALLTLLVIVLAWDTPYRDWIVLALAVLYGVIGGVLMWRVRDQIRGTGLHPFANTLDELQRDARWLTNQAVQDDKRHQDTQDTGL
jgi:uncharacterized membrane protein YqjE